MNRTAPHRYSSSNQYSFGKPPRTSIGHELLDQSSVEQVALAVGPKLIPQVETDEVFWDFLINEVHLKNDGAQTATVWVRDRQSPPCAVIPTQQLPPGGMISLDSAAGYYSPNGLTWYSSTPGVVGYAIGTACTS